MDQLKFTVIPPGKAVTLNQRMHWREEAARKKEWRDAAYWCAKQQVCRLVGTLDGRWSIQLSFPVMREIRRDPHNWVRTSKWIIDGLVLAALLEDDDEKHLVMLDAAFHTRSQNPNVVVTMRRVV